MEQSVAVLYCDPSGVYSEIPGLDLWGVDRDARRYSGPWPVVAHPPCQRWGRYASRYGAVGDDGGCWDSALAAVDRWGGVLEHPEGSVAFTRDISKISRYSGWVRARAGWACYVEQHWYGHRGIKPTWLYCVGYKPEPLEHGPCVVWMEPVGVDSRDRRAYGRACRDRLQKAGIMPIESMNTRERTDAADAREGTGKASEKFDRIP